MRLTRTQKQRLRDAVERNRGLGTGQTAKALEAALDRLDQLETALDLAMECKITPTDVVRLGEGERP